MSVGTLFDMLRRKVVIFAIILLCPGCGTGSFVGQRFDNFTAYYNAFYNAQRSFNDGYDNLRHKDDPVNRDYYLPLFVRPTGNTGSREFESAIRKSADVLRNHPDSKWVDDALLLIGKSYFYQEAFVGALQKFREVIDLNTDLENEARFWLSRTLITSGALDDALTELQQSLAREDVPGEWAALYRLALGELYVKRSEWDESATVLSEGLNDAKDKEIGARAQFLLGQTYETMGRYVESVEAFKSVRDFNPLYELSYAARYSAVRVDGFYGDTEKALKDLRRMERDDKNYSYRFELTYLRARILQAVGDADGAYEIYDRLLYDQDPTTNIGALRGKIHFALGELYRDLERDFVMASAHLDTASTSLTRPITAGVASSYTRKAQYTAEAITNIDELKVSFGAFARVFKNVSRMDSLLWLGRMDQEEFDEKILEMRRERARKLEEQRRMMQARQLEQQFRQGASVQDPFANRTLPSGKIIPTKNDPTGTNSGFLFHRNPARIDDGRANFILKWGDRPLVPNWRRFEAISGAAEEQALNGEEQTLALEELGEDELPAVDISGVPRDSLSQARMESERALVRYELGNTLFLAMARPDSAAVWYRMVIEEDGEEPVAQRAFYALAEVQNALGDSLAADRIYRQILVDYPESDFAGRIRAGLGQAMEQALPDSAALAEMAYDEVFRKWMRSENDGLLDDMLSVAAAYPGMDIQAKALLAAGEIHMETAGADTTALFTELSVSLPDSIIGIIWPDKLVQAVPVQSDGEVAESDTTVADSTGIGAVARDSTLVEAPGETPARDSTAVRWPDAPAEEVVVDSLEVGAVIQAAAIDSTDVPSDLLLSKVDRGEPSEREYHRPVIVIQDVFTKVSENFARTAFADRANDLLTAFDEIRYPPVDTSKMVESLALSVDSLSIANVAYTVTPDSLGREPGLQTVPADSLQAGLMEDLLEASRPESSGGLIPDPLTAMKLVPGDTTSTGPIDAEHPERKSGSLRPLLPTGQPDKDVSGWTIILEKSPNIGAARVASARYEVIFSTSESKVMIISGNEEGRPEFLIGWGVFPDKHAAYEAVVEAGESIPDSYEYLHMMDSD